MSIDIGYAIDRDPDAGYLTFFINYSIAAYIDPESGEYFGDTTWNVSYSLASNPSPAFLAGTGAESDTVMLDLYLDGSPSIVNYRLIFSAWNTFMPAPETQVWNVLTAAFATAPQSFVGTDSIDFAIGGAAGDAFQLGDGDDRVDAGGGNDKIDGGAGSDHLDGGTGDDTMTGGADNDFYIVDSVNDIVVELAGGGIDTVTSSVAFTLAAQVENLTLTGFGANAGTGNGGANLIIGNGAANVLSGLGDNDELRGGASDDTLYGGAGNDVLKGDSGADTMDGGLNNDTYYVDSAFDHVVEAANGGVDSVFVTGLSVYALGSQVENLATLDMTGFRGIGNAFDNKITGAQGNDLLDGRDGGDTLLGEEGNDRLIGGAGADILVGDAGIDTAEYTASAAAVTVNLATGRGYGGDAQGDRLYGIEFIVGSAYGDVLTGDALANRLTGGGGSDQLQGGDGADTLIGGAGADYLYGGIGSDTASYAGSLARVVVDLSGPTASGGDAQGDYLNSIENVAGGNGNDSLTGNTLANALSGGIGMDILSGGGGNDSINGGVGADELDGGADNDTLSYAGSIGAVNVNLVTQIVFGGDAEGDMIRSFENAVGGDGSDTLTGNNGNNALTGGAGSDVINGAKGNDYIRGGSGADTMTGGSDVDTLSYAGSLAGGVTISLTGNVAHDGDAQGDIIENFENVDGSEWGDILIGDTNANRLSGRAGHDYLDGRTGNDTLAGGAQTDAFAFGYFSGRDTITDFSVADGETVTITWGLAFDTFDEVMAIASATGASGRDTLFTFNANNSLLMQNVSMASLTDASFLFA